MLSFCPDHACAYLPSRLRIFTITGISPAQPAHIYHHAKIACAYLPSRLRIFTITPAHIYHHACAYLPSLGHLSTGVYLRVSLFSQVAYNYIPVSLYPGVINQQNRSLRVLFMLPPRLAARWAAAQINRFGCHQNLAIKAKKFL